MTGRKVMGVDPGGHGAFYELDEVDGKWVPGRYLLMPFEESEARVKDVDVSAVIDFIADTHYDLIVLEDVGYMPSGEGGTGFKGGAFTACILTSRVRDLLGMFKTLNRLKRTSDECRMVRTLTWQGALGIRLMRIAKEKREKRKKRIKAAVLTWVQTAYPDAQLVPQGCRVPHDGLVDALAMAHYAATQLPDNNILPTVVKKGRKKK